MKLVINKCFGGFGLSPKAIARLAELRGKTAYFFIGGTGGEPRRQVPMEKLNSAFWMAYYTPTPANYKEWNGLSDEQRAAIRAESVEDCRDHDKRTDPDLIRVVEELGIAANGDCAQLGVVEIPDGVDWTIDEYDGVESVHEKHRSWH